MFFDIPSLRVIVGARERGRTVIVKLWQIRNIDAITNRVDKSIRLTNFLAMHNVNISHEKNWTKMVKKNYLKIF